MRRPSHVWFEVFLPRFVNATYMSFNRTCDGPVANTVAVLMLSTCTQPAPVAPLEKAGGVPRRRLEGHIRVRPRGVDARVVRERLTAVAVATGDLDHVPDRRLWKAPLKVRQGVAALVQLLESLLLVDTYKFAEPLPEHPAAAALSVAVADTFPAASSAATPSV